MLSNFYPAVASPTCDRSVCFAVETHGPWLAQAGPRVEYTWQVFVALTIGVFRNALDHHETSAITSTDTGGSRQLGRSVEL